MTQIEDMLEAFVMHYGALRYTKGQRGELIDKYRWLKNAYKNLVYDSVVANHPASLRSLPDTAVIEKAMNALGRPEVYDQSSEQLALPEPGAVDRSVDVAHITAVLTGHADARDRKPDEPEINHVERERIRVRVLKGQATEHEAFWIRCIDQHDWDWRAALSAEGKPADDFETSGVPA